MTDITTEDIARVAHEANRAYQIVTHDPAVSPHWEDAPEWQRTSAVNGVAKALDGYSAAELHVSWCAEKAATGWTYGPVKDADAKTHPCLVAYNDLPEDQKVKDHLFAAVVRTLAP